ncbi:MAG: hypothetical protein L0Z73_19050 [Gammaproteobacteria bacterium]|nr:hypothetical protein [Gammaproteobacteria bacterium]
MNTNKRNLIEGRLHVVLRKPGGAPIMERHVSNTVMRSGAELVAALFRGELSTPINGMAVGIDNTPATPPYEITALTTTHPDGSPAIQQATVVIQPEVIRTDVLTDLLKVRVTVRAVIPENHATSPDGNDPRVMLGEAALGVLEEGGESLARIYNRVVFEPIPKTPDHEVALYWEVDFPYGP